MKYQMLLVVGYAKSNLPLPREKRKEKKKEEKEEEKNYIRYFIAVRNKIKPVLYNPTKESAMLKGIRHGNINVVTLFHESTLYYVH